MTLSGRNEDAPIQGDDLSATTERFILWASEFDLIDVALDEDGEFLFTKAACEHEEFDDDGVEYVEEAPLPLPRRAPRRRLSKAAIPVAASMALATTAYAAHVVTSPSVTYQAKSGETIHVKGGIASVEKNAPIVAAPRQAAGVKGAAASPMLVENVAAQKAKGPRSAPAVSKSVERVTRAAMSTAGLPWTSLPLNVLAVVDDVTEEAPEIVKGVKAKVSVDRKTTVTVGLPGGITITLKSEEIQPLRKHTLGAVPQGLIGFLPEVHFPTEIPVVEEPTVEPLPEPAPAPEPETTPQEDVVVALPVVDALEKTVLPEPQPTVDPQPTNTQPTETPVETPATPEPTRDAATLVETDTPIDAVLVPVQEALTLP